MRNVTRRDLTNLSRAIANQSPVTVKYTKESGETSIRVLEPTDLRVSEDGAFLLVGLDRNREDEDGNPGRRTTLRVDRIVKYRTNARGRFVLAHEEPEVAEDPSRDLPNATQADIAANMALELDARGFGDTDEATSLWWFACDMWDLAHYEAQREENRAQVAAAAHTDHPVGYLAHEGDFRCPDCASDVSWPLRSVNTDDHGARCSYCKVTLVA